MLHRYLQIKIHAQKPIHTNKPMQFRTAASDFAPVRLIFRITGVSATAERISTSRSVRHVARSTQRHTPRIAPVFYHRYSGSVNRGSNTAPRAAPTAAFIQQPRAMPRPQSEGPSAARRSRSTGASFRSAAHQPLRPDGSARTGPTDSRSPQGSPPATHERARTARWSWSFPGH